jgi:IS4 transposase
MNELDDVPIETVFTLLLTAEHDIEKLTTRLEETKEARDNIKKDYDDIFVQLLQRHRDVHMLEKKITKLVMGLTRIQAEAEGYHPRTIARFARSILEGLEKDG